MSLQDLLKSVGFPEGGAATTDKRQGMLYALMKLDEARACIVDVMGSDDVNFLNATATEPLPEPAAPEPKFDVKFDPPPPVAAEPAPAPAPKKKRHHRQHDTFNAVIECILRNPVSRSMSWDNLVLDAQMVSKQSRSTVMTCIATMAKIGILVVGVENGRKVARMNVSCYEVAADFWAIERRCKAPFRYAVD